eukprot:gene14182-biopygen2051
MIHLCNNVYSNEWAGEPHPRTPRRPAAPGVRVGLRTRARSGDGAREATAEFAGRGAERRFRARPKRDVGEEGTHGIYT